MNDKPLFPSYLQIIIEIVGQTVSEITMENECAD